MNGVLDKLLVGIVLFFGFGYAAYSLGPKSLRKQMLRCLAALLGHAPDLLGARGAAQRLAAAASRSVQCGGCGSCAADKGGGAVERAAGEDGAGESGAGEGGAVSANSSAGARGLVAEINIPLSRIGKR